MPMCGTDTTFKTQQESLTPLESQDELGLSLDTLVVADDYGTDQAMGRHFGSKEFGYEDRLLQSFFYGHGRYQQDLMKIYMYLVVTKPFFGEF